MLNKAANRLLPLSFVGFCFCIGISIGLLIKLGKIQASDSRSVPVEVVPLPKISLPPATQEELFNDTLTIQAVGDIIPGTNYPDNRLPSHRNKLIPKSVRSHLQRADILFGNFESSLTNHPYSSKDITQGQTFAFRSPPSYAKLFSEVGFDVLNIANNHAMDFGNVGFKDTVKNLENVNIATVGHKNQILLLSGNKIPVAMIGFAPYKQYNSIHDLQTATKLVKTAQEKAKIVIVSMHAGAEGTNALRTKNQTEFFYGENRGNSVNFARKMIDAGADLVLGHGPHVPRAMEIYQGKLIAYSLGNFLGYRTLSTTGETGDSMILEIKLKGSGELAAAKIVPIRMDKRGIPHIDQRFRVISLLRNLMAADFPKTAVTINRQGEIVLASK
ncbi:CapA family protein [Calothrix sp. PCC 6303]|uniref:CapA family protein n=1 Tax=Calothrix sp. PCC 6303 TaxID=1170562 RepID=UPI0002A00C8D|nr:CapA family protein [Calothrix sp. PCC 6303]AFZ04068.1 Capsule synthesis protein, CapA [Calothrix sp. PCC 6303]